jgi:hypothetical protein
MADRKAKSGFEQLREEIQGMAREIPAPLVERVGAGYKLTFTEQRVEMLVPRVHWHKEEAVITWAINILPIRPTDPVTRLEFGKLALYATTTRASLAKHLASRGFEANWPAILSLACWLILEQETVGGEPTDLFTYTIADDDSPQLLGNLCLKDNPSMIFGNGGDGKSYVALGAALSLVTGRAILDIEPAESMTVAYCDWEWDEKEHARRVRRLLGADGLEGHRHRLLHFGCKLPLVREVDRLALSFQRHGVGYAIIDSVTWAVGGDPTEAEPTTQFLLAVRQLGVGTLSVAHISAASDTMRPFGSVQWHNGMRSTWYVKKQQEVGEDGIAIGLFHRKANGVRLDRPMAFSVHFDEGAAPHRPGIEARTTIVRSRISRVRELADSQALRDRIVMVLKEHAGRPMTADQIALELKVDAKAVRDKLAGSDKLFTALPGVDGNRSRRWALKAREPEQVTLSDTWKSEESAEEPPRPGPEPAAASEPAVPPVLACPSCGFDSYQPIGGGRRMCLSCEYVWE